MSKERVLLKEFIDFVDSYEFYPTERNIIFEIVNRANAILAQPEQTEQEPVAWIYEWVDEAGEPVKSVAYNFYDDANPIPLYTAPPKQPESTAEAIMPNGVCVSNVYDAYEEGRKSVMSEQEPDSYTTGVAAKKLFRVLGWTNKGEEK